MYIGRMKRVFLCVAVGLAVTGCAGTAVGDALSSHLKSSSARAPSALDSIPTNTGLVVLDFKVVIKRFWGEEELDVNGASIQQMKPGSKVLYSGPVYSGFLGRTSVGVLFHDLQPGQYQVATLGAQRANPFQTFQVYAPKTTELTFDVEAGQPVYVGMFVARLDGTSIGTSWQKGTERELDVWRSIRSKYSPSKWDAAIDEKIASLQTGSQ